MKIKYGIAWYEKKGHRKVRHSKNAKMSVRATIDDTHKIFTAIIRKHRKDYPDVSVIGWCEDK